MTGCGDDRRAPAAAAVQARLDQLRPRLNGAPALPLGSPWRNGRSAAQRLVQGDPEAEDVGRGARDTRRVAGRPAPEPDTRRCRSTWSSSAASSQGASDAEVDQPRRRPHDDVARLDVEVYHRSPSTDSAAPSRAPVPAASQLLHRQRTDTAGAASTAADRPGARAPDGAARRPGRRRTTAPLPGATAVQHLDLARRARDGSLGRRPGLGRTTLTTTGAKSRSCQPRYASYRLSATQLALGADAGDELVPGAHATMSFSIGRLPSAGVVAGVVVGVVAETSPGPVSTVTWSSPS